MTVDRPWGHGQADCAYATLGQLSLIQAPYRSTMPRQPCRPANTRALWSPGLKGPIQPYRPTLAQVSMAYLQAYREPKVADSPG